MQRIISHRANLNGSDENENSPSKVNQCIANGFDVEIDIWQLNNQLFLGHDNPTYPINLNWLSEIKDHLWVHCKNIDALLALKDNFNCFSHDKDDCVLTSSKHIWVYPNKQLVDNSIAVLPEKTNYSIDDLKKCDGICTDFPIKYKTLLNPRKKYIYYHIAQMGEWREVVADQLNFITTTGLYDAVDGIFVGMLGNETIELPEKCQFIYRSNDLNEAELPTLNKLHEHSNREDFNVLYLHTKGVSWQSQGKNRDCLIAWRKYMEYFCVERWNECIAHLHNHDAVGVQWMNKSDAFNGHFSGNFWWSKSEYIRTLPNVNNVVLTPYHSMIPRMKAEFWLGSHENINSKSLFYYNDDFYANVIKESIYKA